jgi:hypothetical protein
MRVCAANWLNVLKVCRRLQTLAPPKQRSDAKRRCGSIVARMGIGRDASCVQSGHTPAIRNAPTSFCSTWSCGWDECSVADERSYGVCERGCIGGF